MLCKSANKYIIPYQIYSTTGSLLYRGTDAEVALPRGIYVVRYGNAIEKVVL